MFKEYLISLVLLGCGCILIGLEVGINLGCGISMVLTAFFIIGWKLILQGIKKSNKEKNKNDE